MDKKLGAGWTIDPPQHCFNTLVSFDNQGPVRVRLDDLCLSLHELGRVATPLLEYPKSLIAI